MTDIAPPRRVAAQARSRKTVERILACAADLVAEKGVDPVTMTEIAAAAGISMGTVYQYFDDKSSIMQELLARHNEGVETMIVSALSGSTSLGDMIDRLVRTYRVYADLHRDNPFYRSIWSAVRADTDLQDLDARDSMVKGRILFAVARPLYDEVDDDLLMGTCALVMHLSMTAARFALLVDAPLDRHITPAFEEMVASTFLKLERHGPGATGRLPVGVNDPPATERPADGAGGDRCPRPRPQRTRRQQR